MKLVVRIDHVSQRGVVNDSTLKANVADPKGRQDFEAEEAWTLYGHIREAKLGLGPGVFMVDPERAADDTLVVRVEIRQVPMPIADVVNTIRGYALEAFGQF